jgi:leucyl/phenylalanyl-tRNA--protein transferase
VSLIDCQVTTAHLLRLGAREIPRARFLARLHEALRAPVRPERW